MVRFWRRLSLLQRFSFTNAVVAIALAVILSAATVQAITSFAVRDEAQVAAELVLRTITAQLDPTDFAGALPRARAAFLDGLFRAHGISDRVLRIRLWRADGKLLYSNASEPASLKMSGVDLSAPGGFERLLKRQARVDRATPEVLRFFVPVVMPDEAKPLAAFEIFTDLTRLNQQLGRIRAIVWTTVPLGVLVSYVAVFMLVRNASQRLHKQQADLKVAHLGTFESLATAIDAKDTATGSHSSNVARLSTVLAMELGLTVAEIEEVRICGRLHDVGKIAIPDAILLKPGPLDLLELPIMRSHVEHGYEILRSAPLSENIKQGVLASHERWDGKGYPRGLAGETIPLIARIVAVVDAYDVMTSDRPYRNALSFNEALRRLQRDAGAQFDAAVVRGFVTLIRNGELPHSRLAAASG